MNADELAANPQARSWVVHDLNADPVLPFADDAFDHATCCVSVDYLTRPVEVFRDVARVVRARWAVRVHVLEPPVPDEGDPRLAALRERGAPARSSPSTSRAAGGYEPASRAQCATPPGGDPLYAVWARVVVSGRGRRRAPRRSGTTAGSGESPVLDAEPRHVLVDRGARRGHVGVGDAHERELVVVDDRVLGNVDRDLDRRALDRRRSPAARRIPVGALGVGERERPGRRLARRGRRAAAAGTARATSATTHGLRSAACQHANARRPPARRWRAMFVNAVTGSSKNMTPN